MNGLMRRFGWPVLVIGLVAPAMANCGGKLPGGVGGLPSVPGGCSLDPTKAEAIAAFDFQKEFNISAEQAGKLKAGTIAAVELKGFADGIDADLKAACGGLAKDLGQTGEFKSGEESCKAAIKAIGDFKAKMGANAKVAVEIDPPKCGVSMDAVAECAGKCDATVKPGSAKVECEPGKLQGTCDAKCSGTCEMTAAAKCDGKCSGSCEGGFKGTCGGNCDGKCDGKNTKGHCAGTCEGKCDVKASGTCSGQCGGSCEMKGAADCKGTCTGSCSAEMKAPKCTGEVKPPQMSAECKAQCDAQVNAKAECTPAKVSVVIAGAADAKAAEQFKAAMEKNFPGVLKIAVGMGEKSVKMAGNVKTVVEGVQSSIQGMASGGAGAMGVAKITGCLASPFKGAIDAAASLKANVDVSVQVKASATASASGSASGGAKTLN